MIEAHFYKNNRGKLYSFKITGHAESGPYGHDLVCSAVSALSISIVNSLIKLVDISPSIYQNETEGGYLEVEIPEDLSETKDGHSQLLLEHFLLAVKGIEDEYNEYIKVSEN